MNGRSTVLTCAIVVALLSEGCSRGSSATPLAPTPPSATITIPEDLADVEIALERTECFGWCPCYSVTIRGDGRVKYTGRRFVRENGECDGTISKDEVRTLLKLFLRADFFSMDQSYLSHEVTDAPTAYVALRIGERSKRLGSSWARGADDFPPEMFEEWKAHTILNMLAHSIDRTVDVERWIGSAEERRKLPR